MEKSQQQHATMALTFGVVFLVALLVAAFVVQSPTPFQLFVFRLVLALAAAGVVVVLGGLLEVTAGWIRATGARLLKLSYGAGPVISNMSGIQAWVRPMGIQPARAFLRTHAKIMA